MLYVLILLAEMKSLSLSVWYWHGGEKHLNLPPWTLKKQQGQINKKHVKQTKKCHMA